MSSTRPTNADQTNPGAWPPPNPGAWPPPNPVSMTAFGGPPQAPTVPDRHVHAGHGHTDFAHGGYGSPIPTMGDPRHPGAEYARPGYPMPATYPQAGGAPQSYYVQPSAGGSSKRWIIALVAGAVVAVLVVAGVLLGAAAKTTPTAAPVAAHTVSLPTAVAGFYRLQNPAAAVVAKAMSAQMTALGSQWKAGQVGVYSATGTARPALILYTISAADSPQFASQLPAATPSQLASEAFTGSGITDEKDYPAGVFGGVLRCGSGRSSGVDVGLCIWVDSSTMGMVAMPNTTPANTAVAAQTMRNVTEH